MTELKIGDHVRGIVEGMVTEVYNGGAVAVEYQTYLSASGRFGVVSIEVIPEPPVVLPAKMHAQVMEAKPIGKADVLWTRIYHDGTNMHEWGSIFGDRITSELLATYTFRVISEGVDE